MVAFLGSPLKSFTFPGDSLGRREQGTHSGFLGMVFLTLHRSFPGNARSLWKFLWNWKEFFGWKLSAWSLEWSLQWPGQVMCPLLGTSLGFSPWQTPQSGLKIKQHLSSAEAELAGEVERDFVCVWAFCFWVCFIFFFPSPHRSGSELLEGRGSSHVRQGAGSRHWNVLPQWKGKRGEGEGKKKS